MSYKKGDLVEVVSGRKVPVGCKGVLVWFGPDKFNKGYRAGVKFENRNDVIFLAMSNLVDHSLEARCEAAAKAASEKKSAGDALVAKCLKISELFYSNPEMHAYSDSVVISIPLADPSASDEEIGKALRYAFPVTSSWGALRWRSGIGNIEINREAGVVKFVEYTGICD